MAHSTLEDDFKRNDLPCSTEKTKVQLNASAIIDKERVVKARMGLHLYLLYEVAGEVERTIGFELV
ncbi:hypothetical protein NC651_038726 [Populus alba x Populus x berolinensis]|nr:hypothetical protein NC651_038726 [Populus alba x Populus x berolinensis]